MTIVLVPPTLLRHRGAPSVATGVTPHNVGDELCQPGRALPVL